MGKVSFISQAVAAATWWSRYRRDKEEGKEADAVDLIFFLFLVF
jgi:hypothetical protein